MMTREIRAQPPARMRARTRISAFAAALLLAVAVSAGPAHATPYVEGSVSCGMSQPQSWVQYRAHGTGVVSPPGSTAQHWFTHIGWDTDHRSGELYGGAWSVSSLGAVDPDETYGYCSL